MIMKGWLLVLIGCQQNTKAPVPAPKAVAPVAPADASVMHSVVIDAPRPETVETLLDDLETGMPRICFAVSANHRRVACTDELEIREGRVMGSRGVEILGDLGSASHSWEFWHVDRERHDDDNLGVTNQIELTDLRRALVERHYEPYDAHGQPLVDSLAIGKWTLHRDHPHDSSVEIDCRDGSRTLALAGSEGAFEETEILVSLFGAKLLFEIRSDHGYEGGETKTTGAQLLDPVAVCAR